MDKERKPGMFVLYAAAAAAAGCRRPVEVDTANAQQARTYSNPFEEEMLEAGYRPVEMDIDVLPSAAYYTNGTEIAVVASAESQSEFMANVQSARMARRGIPIASREMEAARIPTSEELSDAVERLSIQVSSPRVTRRRDYSSMGDRVTVYESYSKASAELSVFPEERSEYLVNAGDFGEKQAAANSNANTGNAQAAAYHNANAQTTADSNVDSGNAQAGAVQEEAQAGADVQQPAGHEANAEADSSAQPADASASHVEAQADANAQADADVQPAENLEEAVSGAEAETEARVAVPPRQTEEKKEFSTGVGGLLGFGAICAATGILCYEAIRRYVSGRKPRRRKR
jgi:hypothetical protein